MQVMIKETEQISKKLQITSFVMLIQLNPIW